MTKIITVLVLIAIVLTQAAGSCIGDACPPGTVSKYHCSESAGTCWTVCVER